MTNLQSIAGGAAWMLVSALLACAALEPVSVPQLDSGAAIACATAACPSA